MPDCEIPESNASSDEIAEILRTAKTIAVVGLSPKPERPSHGVTAYMQDQGYTILPVNPGHSEILGKTCYKSLLDVPKPIDIVNIFREPSAVPEIVDQAIAKKAKAIWMQEGIVHNAAAEKAQAAGLKVVMNRCIYKEHARLMAD
jgi:predicted CoA-binding protein